MISLKNRSGIYEIKNMVTGDTYIGSSINLEDRWRRHRRDLRKGTHHSRYLNRAWNKYGEDKFRFTVLEFLSPKDLLTQESMYLLYNCPIYNTNSLATSSAGTKRSNATKMKIGAAIRRLGIRPPEATWRDRQKSVCAIDPKTDTVIEIFPSLAAACRWAGRDHTYVTMLTRCCNGLAVRGLAWGYKWKWNDTFNEGRQ